MFFDIEAMQNTGKHIANLVIGMTAENTDPKIFRGPQWVDHFLEWLEVLTEEEAREITVLAHNFKGYNSYFIVDALHHLLVLKRLPSLCHFYNEFSSDYK